MSTRILLVEDDPHLGALTEDYLRVAGFAVTWVDRGDLALQEDAHAYDLAILDLMLPGAYGLDILKHLRASSDLPVMILSGRKDIHEKVKALDLGADDYVVKPFSAQELLARVRGALRRPTLERGGQITAGLLAIDAGRRTASIDGAPLELTRVEFDLLLALARRAGTAVERAWLVDAVLDPDRSGGERTLDVHVSRLRKKLGEHGSMLATLRNVGYRLDA